MTDDLRARADARLEQALAAAGIRDPRPHLRPVLRHLKERDPDAYGRAVSHLETTLVPAVAGGADPLAAWLDYARLLGGLTGSGTTFAIDATGRATPLASDEVPAEDALLLHLPDAPDAPAAVLRCPAETSPAQAASIKLLALGRTA